MSYENEGREGKSGGDRFMPPRTFVGESSITGISVDDVGNVQGNRRWYQAGMKIL